MIEFNSNLLNSFLKGTRWYPDSAKWRKQKQRGLVNGTMIYTLQTGVLIPRCTLDIPHINFSTLPHRKHFEKGYFNHPASYPKAFLKSVVIKRHYDPFYLKNSHQFQIPIKDLINGFFSDQVVQPSMSDRINHLVWFIPHSAVRWFGMYSNVYILGDERCLTSQENVRTRGKERENKVVLLFNSFPRTHKQENTKYQLRNN